MVPFSVILKINIFDTNKSSSKFSSLDKTLSLSYAYYLGLKRSGPEIVQYIFLSLLEK